MDPHQEKLEPVTRLPEDDHVEIDQVIIEGLPISADDESVEIEEVVIEAIPFSHESDAGADEQASSSESPPPGPELVTEYDLIMARFKTSARRLPKYGRLAANMLRDDRIPAEARGALVIGGAYVISPIDLIPGFIPVLGQLDDLLVALLGLRFALNQAPTEVREEHLQRAGLREEDFSDDLRTVRDTSIYLVKSGARRTVHGMERMARSASRRMRRFTSRGENAA